MFQRFKLPSVSSLPPYHGPAPHFLPILEPRGKNNRLSHSSFWSGHQTSEHQSFVLIEKVRINQSISSCWVSANAPSLPKKPLKISCCSCFSSYWKTCMCVYTRAHTHTHPPFYHVLTSHIQSCDYHKPPFQKPKMTGNIFQVKPAGSERVWPLSPHLKPILQSISSTEFQPIPALPTFTFENSQDLWDLRPESWSESLCLNQSPLPTKVQVLSFRSGDCMVWISAAPRGEPHTAPQWVSGGTFSSSGLLHFIFRTGRNAMAGLLPEQLLLQSRCWGMMSSQNKVINYVETSWSCYRMFMWYLRRSKFLALSF